MLIINHSRHILLLNDFDTEEAADWVEFIYESSSVAFVLAKCLSFYKPSVWASFVVLFLGSNISNHGRDIIYITLSLFAGCFYRSYCPWFCTKNNIFKCWHSSIRIFLKQSSHQIWIVSPWLTVLICVDLTMNLIGEQNNKFLFDYTLYISKSFLYFRPSFL